MNVEHLYTEDEIILIGDHLKNLKGKILMDDHKQFFILKDFDIKSVTVEEFRLFKPNVKVQKFYIDSMTLSSGDEEYIHQDDIMCSVHGIKTLMDYQVNYSALEKNLINFTLKNKITLKYGDLIVSKPNKSSDFKRR